MKLFITNKKKLDDMFPNDGNTRYKTSKEIHQDAFRELELSINSKNSIPLCLTPDYKDFGCVLLDFINKKDDVYFYEFTTTAS
jgi:hypothetical protein